MWSVPAFTGPRLAGPWDTSVQETPYSRQESGHRAHLCGLSSSGGFTSFLLCPLWFGGFYVNDYKKRAELLPTDNIRSQSSGGE